MDTLFEIHSYMRWPVVLVALLAILRLAQNLVFAGRASDPFSGLLMKILGIILDVQVALGVIYLVWNGTKYDFWPRARFEHLGVMLLAAGTAHLSPRWKNTPTVTRTRNDLLLALGVMALVFFGVALLPGHMERWY